MKRTRSLTSVFGDFHFDTRDSLFDIQLFIDSKASRRLRLGVKRWTHALVYRDCIAGVERLFRSPCRY